MLFTALLTVVVPFVAAQQAPVAAPPLVNDPIAFTLVPKGGMALIGNYRPQRAELSASKPATIRKLPAGLVAPLYGTLSLGGTVVVLDEPDGQPAHLYVDTNHDGDLTDDPACDWAGKEQKSEDGPTYTMFQGSMQVDIGEAGKAVLVSLGCYRFDKRDPKRDALKNTLLYYRDYAAQGTLQVGGKTCKAVLDDSMVRGDFRGAAAGDGSGVSLLLDVNGNGKFDSQGERFDVRQPFNVGGTTWELADIARDGTSLRLVKSTSTVAEVPTPPDLGVGQTLPAFEAKDAAGNELKFPADYAGKIVLLDFWATWCGPCMHEMPNVVATYAKFHPRGFEIQGISLDDEKTIASMPDVMQKAGMTWRQVADGKGWKAAIAERFAIESIPATFLVDGSTGKILGANLRGEALAAAVDKALADRKAN